MTLSQNIKNARIHSGITQKEMAKRVGLSASALSLIESGSREPTVAFLRQFSKEANTRISVLFDEPLPAEDWRLQAVQDTLEDHEMQINRLQEILREKGIIHDPSIPFKLSSLS